AALAVLIDAHADLVATASGTTLRITSATPAQLRVAAASPAAISVSSETLEDVAAALAAQIDDTAAGFTATARGTTLVIARATGSFAVGRAVTPLDGSAAAAAPASSVLTLTGTPGEG